MPESRDRLSRQDNIIGSYSQRRISRAGASISGRGSSIAFVLEDDNEEEQASRTPFRWRDTTMAGEQGLITPRIRPARNSSPVVGNGRSYGGASGSGTPRIRRIAPLRGPENFSPVVGSGRGHSHGGRGGGVLPTWYPRRPLNDITALVREMERRRERGGDGEGLRTESPILHDQVSTPSARLTMISPKPMFSNRHFIGKVPKILLDITHQNRGDADRVTPQKKLLHSIDTVEKVVMEELRKLKRTPSAKKAEREKRVRTLMSMR